MCWNGDSLTYDPQSHALSQDENKLKGHLCWSCWLFWVCGQSTPAEQHISHKISVLGIKLTRQTIYTLLYAIHTLITYKTWAAEKVSRIPFQWKWKRYLLLWLNEPVYSFRNCLHCFLHLTYLSKRINLQRGQRFSPQLTRKKPNKQIPTWPHPAALQHYHYSLWDEYTLIDILLHHPRISTFIWNKTVSRQNI